MIYEIKNVTLAYPGMPPVVKGAAFALEQGEILSILGPNGAGKSTLLNSMTNLHTPSQGTIALLGRPIASMSPREIAKNVAYVRQNQSAAFAFSVRDFVLMGRAANLGAFKRPGQEDRAVAERAMRIMGVEHLADRPYTNISGGQRQQVVIARALAQEPKVILLDEPTAHLDFGNQLKVLLLIRRLSQMGYAVVFTTHDPNHAILLGGTVGILNREGIFQYGGCETMLTEETLSQLYHIRLRLLEIPDIGRKTCTCDRLERLAHMMETTKETS